MFRLTAIVACLLVCCPFAHAQQPVDTTPQGEVYIGGAVGVLGGSGANLTGLFHRYDLVDGSGTYFSGFNIGYDHRSTSGLVFGGVSDIAFGAEPPDGGPHADGFELFGSVRARAGVDRRGWFGYG